ncbi:MAG: Sec-independent protein translocase protein TatB [Novosphingobium sp.]|jgi:sec-independent protein translocase protein TatB|nr:Sec-independent protein translocase protein TatB [Novosphingobium sp.]
MFDIGGSELLLIVIVAIVAIGPKDLPRALRLAGQWIAKMRRISGHFRSGIETMIREAELEEMERKWREQNEAIMQAQAPQASGEAVLPLPHEPAEPARQEQPEPPLAAIDRPLP